MGLMEEMKTEFFKMTGDKLTFQLINLEENKEFKIYDSRATDKNMQWYSAGMSIDTCPSDPAIPKETFKVEELEFIKTDAWNKYFKGQGAPNGGPQFTRMTQIIRNVIIDGKECKFGFKKTANEELNKLLKNMQGMGNNPLDYQYLMTKTGEKLTTKYEIVVAGKALPKPTPAPSVKLAIKQTKITIGNMSIPAPTELESELIKAYKTIQEKEYQTFETFKSIYEDNKEDLGVIDEIRLKELFSIN